MTTTPPSTGAGSGELSLRERTRRAVQGELIDVAQRLFVDQGYEATTVEQVAAAAGISRSSFFRYFSGKEDLVLGKYDRTGEQLADELRRRPLDEPLWVSLRLVLDPVVQYATDAGRAASMRQLDQVVLSSEALRGAYLARVDGMQRTLAEIARERAEQTGHPWADDDPAPRAVVGAAFACLRAATEIAARTGTDLATALDRGMTALAPLDRPGPGGP